MPANVVVKTQWGEKTSPAVLSLPPCVQSGTPFVWNKIIVADGICTGSLRKNFLKSLSNLHPRRIVEVSDFTH